MFLNGYSVRIPEGKETQGGYIEIKDKQQFRIVLRNGNPRDCDVRVEVNGKLAGTWRVEAGRRIVLKRPGNDDGYFTAYVASTLGARQAGIDYNDPDLGLVRVTFTPEIEKAVETFSGTVRGLEGTSAERSASFGMLEGASAECGAPFEMSVPTPKAPTSAKPVGVGLSGHSAQTFVQAKPINLDLTRAVTINLRLVSKSDDPRPLVDASSNPVPPRVW
jgi:hypothetical protein